MATDIGKRIRGLRKSKNISFDRLAGMLQMDTDVLKNIENGSTEPAVSDILKIAYAFGVDIASLLFDEKQTSSAVVVTRTTDRIMVHRHTDFKYESLAPYHTTKHIEPFIIEIQRQEVASREFSKHAGEEFHFILTGTLKLTIDTEEFILNAEDSIYFDSSKPHLLESVSETVKIVSAIYSKESMLQITRSRYMRDLIQASKHLGGRSIAVVCPNATALEAINKGMEEGVIDKAYLIGDTSHLSKDLFIFPHLYEYLPLYQESPDYFAAASVKGVELIRRGVCHLLMKGQINTVVFIKAVLDKHRGITIGRRLSLVSIFELPNIDRLIFLTDPAINPALFPVNDIQSSIDIINNAIDVARGLGVVRPKVALLEANEVPSDKIPTSVYEKQLSDMAWKIGRAHV